MLRLASRLIRFAVHDLRLCYLDYGKDHRFCDTPRIEPDSREPGIANSSAVLDQRRFHQSYNRPSTAMTFN
jgi:hypothetical protein